VAVTDISAAEVAAVAAQIAAIGSQVLAVHADVLSVGANIRPILRDVLAIRPNVSLIASYVRTVVHTIAPLRVVVVEISLIGAKVSLVGTQISLVRVEIFLVGANIGPVSGNILAVATSESNSVLLFRRNRDGRFNNAPYQIIGKSLLHYPHDVSFSTWNDGGLLAVAQRAGAIAIYAKNGSNGDYTPVPIVEISGPESKLAFSDGVVFVPPRDHYLAACNLELGTISFFRRATFSPPVFANTPEFELRHENIYHPDGLGLSSCGK